MPGLWELPACRDDDAVALEPVQTVRHSIMQVNYIVRVFAVSAKQADRHAKNRIRRWVAVDEAGKMALTGLARKILSRIGLVASSHRNSAAVIAADGIVEVL
jgi:hypothetical protein